MKDLQRIEQSRGWCDTGSTLKQTVIGADTDAVVVMSNAIVCNLECAGQRTDCRWTELGSERSSLHRDIAKVDVDVTACTPTPEPVGVVIREGMYLFVTVQTRDSPALMVTLVGVQSPLKETE